MKALLTSTRLFLLTAAALMLAATAACSGPSAGPEAEVREWLSVVQTAAEAKKRRKLMSMVSEGYKDAKGYDRDNLEAMLIGYFLRRDSVKVLATVEDVRVIGDSAAEVDVTMVGLAGNDESLLGYSASAYNWSLELQLEDGDWMLISARWRRVGNKQK